MATIPPPPPGTMFVPPPLPPGWTEHKSPTGHTYFYHAATKQSTYTRPLPPIHMGGPVPGPPPLFPPASVPANVNAANPTTDANAPSDVGPDKKSKKSKKEKPAKKTPIPDTPWLRVVTNLGNVFYTHTERKESIWTVPDEIADAVAELEREEEAAKEAKREQEQREKAEQEQREKEEQERLEVERVRKEVEAASAKRKAEESEESAAKKPRVEEEEDEEAWQRQVAEEMAEEEQVPGSDNKSQAKGGETVIPPVFKVPDQVKLNPEEAKALFMTLLNDVSPNPLLPYDLALPQLVNDARYVLLPPNDRKAVFDDWCKDQARNLRKNKTKEATTTPEAAYESLLRGEVKSTRTQWDEFRRKWKKDRRFYGYGRDDKEREKKFRSWLVELGEIKRREAKKAEDDFAELLKTVDGVTKDSEWKDVKRGIAQDPRYDAVGSASRREELFNKFKSSAKHEPSETELTETSSENKGEKEKESKAARRERALKEREAQVRVAQSNVERDINQSRGKLGREEAELELGTVFTDAIRDPLATWDSSLPALESDPRFQHASQVLHVGAQRAKFAAHVEHLRARYISQLHALFEAHMTGLNMPAEALPKSVRGSLPAVKLGFVTDDLDKEGPGEDEDMADDEDNSKSQARLNRGLADEYARWQRGKVTEARLAFDALLGENSFVEFWGRLAKMGGEGVNGGVPVDEDDDENEEGEGGGGKVDMKALAKNVDVSEMEKVLKHDKRYAIFDHVPEQREQWIRDYLSRQAAPKLSVHAPEKQ
ncbi:Transcription elongation regulator 1 AltName: Full=Formin-binding protein 28 [Rhizoctonia solani AG-1 IB]|uniref:Rhizoctonia solani AG1-IB WGS project CAOJ00000000 data, isolate 7/3/14, contig 17765 n=1 Tax=Thanatephorus cucumeris (strain AG1-IB / isolate 7/3/14) TaxID=1108050 RepID=M5C4A1_THACB|nr:Transcription elongation regulator 1 AltName: Full=Formin-binding protein 28 [Rhizoctonia solani AG-1 IB]